MPTASRCCRTSCRCRTTSRHGWPISVIVLVLRGAERVASIGTVPASENPDDAAWREACRAEYLTWSEADGTVIRNGSPDRVPCPLILENGKWVIPGSQEVTSSP